MVQIKIYALRTVLEAHRNTVSDAIHEAITEALAYPREKRFHRFFPLEPEDFIHPRGERYLIVEISMFEGRSVEARKRLIHALYTHLEPLGFLGQDVEITISETPKHHWGIRGLPGDELALEYTVEI